MSEEPQVLSIQDRIRALKQAQTGQGSEGTGSPSLGSQPTAFALRSASSQSNGSNNNNNNNNNNSTVPIQPPPYSKEPPPPVPRISHAGVTPSDVTTGAARQQPKRPPPLPARKSSSQQLAAPSLPPRRPSVDSVASDASRSTNTSTSALSASTTTTGRPSSKPTTPGSVVKAPPWGATELPPLPPKRQNTQPAVSSTVSRPKPKTVASSNGRLPVPPPRPSLPARRSSNQSASTVSTESSITSSQSRQPPQLPRRNTRDKSPGPLACEDTNPPPQPKRLPPPLPSGNALDKIRGSGFGGLSKKVQDINGTSSPAQDAGSAGTPPPVPVGSRPDLSAIMATKPRVAASNGAVTNGAPPPAAIVAAACMICRDFTAPDTHAARYPRQTLPTQDIGWLARELTAPFLSATDKARAIFTWLHHNIDYDTVSFYNNCVKPSTPSSTLASGLAVCEGYAGLFAALAKEAGLEARVVSGHGKGAGYESPAPGAPLPPFSPSGHAWNVVRIDNGHWKLIDPCWGAGHTTGPNMPYVRSFNPSMFTMTNDEFGLKHFPQDKAHLYRDDGRREISWEEYILGDPNSPLCAEQPRTFSDAKKHSIGERSFRPASQKISIRQTGPLRFQFNLFCEHWSLQRHSRAKPGLFLLMIHGVDGRKDERLPFAHWRPSGSDGGGDVWYVDVADARALGAPGQKVQLAVLTKLGQREDARGVTVEEYQRQVGKVGMAWAYIAEWELVV